MWGFIAGFFVGGFVGIFVMALANASRRAEDQLQCDLRELRGSSSRHITRTVIKRDTDSQGAR